MSKIKVVLPTSLDKIHDFSLGSPKRVRLASEIIRVSDNYVPFRTGALKNSAKINDGGAYLTYSTPYATRWYYEKANFVGAPIRGNRWVERAWTNHGKSILKGLMK